MTPLFAFFYGAPVVWQLILCAFVFSYAARAFLLTLEQTAAGSDEVTWPIEPWHDWLQYLLYLVGLSFLWLWPFYVACYFLELPKPIYGLGTLVFAWLIFPITLFSSLSGDSRWMILRPFILWRLLLNIRSLITMYLVS